MRESSDDAVTGEGEDERQAYRRLTTSWGFFRCARTSLLELRGEDRVRFLNGLLTCDVAALELGEAAYGFATDVKGKILSDLVVVARDDRLLLEVPALAIDGLVEHLGKYAIFDQVEIGRKAAAALTVVGPDLAESGVSVPSRPRRAIDVEIDDAPVLVVRQRDVGSLPVCSVWTSPERIEALVGALGAGSEVGRSGWELLRVEGSVPLFGTDFDASTFPQETLQEEAVNYEKGCYLGQEVVARIHYRGGVKKLLRSLDFSSPERPELGAEITAGDRVVGRLTSLVLSPRSRRFLGLAIVHTRAELGETVLVGSSKATLREACP